MITKTLDFVYNQCLKNLCWFDCFGVLAIPMEKQLSEGSKFTVPVAKKFYCPKCEELKYLELTPNDLRTSIAYFEQTSHLNISTIAGMRNWVSFKANVNLVVWYNYKKIGYDHPISEELSIDLMKKLVACKFAKCGEASSYLQNVNLSPIAILDTNPFTKWKYKTKMDVEPHDYIHIACQLSAMFNLNCVDDFECQNEIEC